MNIETICHSSLLIYVKNKNKLQGQLLHQVYNLKKNGNSPYSKMYTKYFGSKPSLTYWIKLAQG